MARILLADDEAAGRDLAQKALAGGGHKVVTADNGVDALALLGKGGIDLLISDIQMPEMDGITLAMQAMAADPQLRVILMSGFADGFHRAEALKPRLKAILAKPVAPRDLLAAVADALA